MKIKIRSIAFIGAILLSSVAVAQQKIGHINAEELLQFMPETKEAQNTLDAYTEQLQKDVKDMEAEFQTKLADLNNNKANMSQIMQDSKTQELQQLQQRIQDYSLRAREDLQKKQLDLLKPIVDKANTAINEVAKENNFTYVFDSSQSKAVVIFAVDSEDIMPLVKAKLGLPE